MKIKRIIKIFKPDPMTVFSARVLEPRFKDVLPLTGGLSVENPSGASQGLKAGDRIQEFDNIN